MAVDVSLTVVIQLLVTAVAVPAIQAALTQLAATAVRVLRRKNAPSKIELYLSNFRGALQMWGRTEPFVISTARGVACLIFIMSAS